MKKMTCLCTRLDENLFTCKIPSSLELWLVRFVFSKEDEESVLLPVFHTSCDIFIHAVTF